MKKTTLVKPFISKKISFTKQWRKSFLLILLALCSGLIFNGCKDENEIGLDQLPPGDQLETVFSDTATLISITEREDSLPSDELSVQLLGSDLDPIFGLSTASIYAQVNLEGTPVFENTPQADSLVLVLAYSGYHGDTNTTQTVNVYQLAEDMHIDSGYYSFKRFDSVSTGPLGTLSFKPQPTSTVVVGSDTLASQIRIRLSQDMADTLIALSGHSAYSSNADWLAYFRGLYLKATDATGPGAISYLNFFNSRMILYFHDATTTGKSYNFSLTGARVNHFSHDFSGFPPGNPSISDTINYVQAMCGLKTKISFPFLKHFLDSGSILVNRAELKILAEPGSTNSPLPEATLLLTRNESGTIVFPIDKFESAGYYGGFLNATSDGYTFNIGRQIQRYLDGTAPNADFYLVISGSGVEANRLIIKSGSNPNTRMKLSLYYTKLN